MVEYVIAKGHEFKCSSIPTDTDFISFTIPASEEPVFSDIDGLFRTVTIMQTANSQKVVHGTYPDLRFEYATHHADCSVTVKMHILNDVEKQLMELNAKQEELKAKQDALEEDQQVQNEAIADIGEIIGG